jgi:copper chaperone NosL
MKLHKLLTKYFSATLFLVVLYGCHPESKPIVYGEDKCEFCRMSIVDQRFGGEIVTQKGKVHKFDAVECMVHYIDREIEDETKLKLILTNSYDSPGELIDAHSCYYLISKNMPSPMGMFLNPFESLDAATVNQQEHSGTIFGWKELRADLMAKR